MDQIYRKTPNPKCRLYWSFIEFMDWGRYSQSCWYFRPLLRRSAPPTFSPGHLPPSPPLSLCEIITGVNVFIHCVTGGRGRWSQMNTCRQIALLVNFKEKSTFRVCCLYRYLVHDPTVQYRKNRENRKKTFIMCINRTLKKISARKNLYLYVAPRTFRSEYC